MRFRSKMAFQNFENVIYFDEVRNEFSQEIGKSSISHEFENFVSGGSRSRNGEKYFLRGKFYKWWKCEAK